MNTIKILETKLLNDDTLRNTFHKHNIAKHFVSCYAKYKHTSMIYTVLNTIVNQSTKISIEVDQMDIQICSRKWSKIFPSCQPNT